MLHLLLPLRLEHKPQAFSTGAYFPDLQNPQQTLHHVLFFSFRDIPSDQALLIISTCFNNVEQYFRYLRASSKVRIQPKHPKNRLDQGN